MCAPDSCNWIWRGQLFAGEWNSLLILHVTPTIASSPAAAWSTNATPSNVRMDYWRWKINDDTTWGGEINRHAAVMLVRQSVRELLKHWTTLCKLSRRDSVVKMGKSKLSIWKITLQSIWYGEQRVLWIALRKVLLLCSLIRLQFFCIVIEVAGNFRW